MWLLNSVPCLPCHWRIEIRGVCAVSTCTGMTYGCTGIILGMHATAILMHLTFTIIFYISVKWTQYYYEKRTLKSSVEPWKWRGRSKKLIQIIRIGHFVLKTESRIFHFLKWATLFSILANSIFSWWYSDRIKMIKGHIRIKFVFFFHFYAIFSLFFLSFSLFFLSFYFIRLGPLKYVLERSKKYQINGVWPQMMFFLQVMYLKAVQYNLILKITLS